MITTIDNVKRKKGNFVWEIGISKDGFRPTRSIVYGVSNRVANPDQCWYDYGLCLGECDKKNKNMNHGR